MYQLISPRSAGVAALVLAVVLSTGTSRSAAQTPAPDPVEELRDALRVPPHDPAARVRTLRQRSAAINTFADLCRAVALEEWRDDNPEPNISSVDAEVRTALFKRFRDRLRDLLRTGDTTTRLAVLATLGHLGTSAQGIGGNGTLTPVFGPDLVALLKQNARSVRAAAARTLGLINPDLAVAIPALSQLLQAEETELRIAAAEGLGNLLRPALWWRVPVENVFFGGISVAPEELVAVGQAVLPVAGRGLRDPSAAVRRLCARTVQQAAMRAARLITEPPPPEQVKDPEECRGQLKAERALLAPVLAALNEQTPNVSRILGDADVTVCLAANEALEAVADLRLQLLDKAATVARFTGDKTVAVSPDDPLRDGLRTTLRPLAEELKHKNLRVRLGALYVLESLEAEAAPLAAGIVAALQDEDAFVRWAAARTLGKLAPLEADKAVPELARRLDDSNGDVRSTAVAALERYGPAAKAAVPELRRALDRKGPALRLGILQVLLALGKEAQAAVPELRTALTAPEATVRAAAARVLGRTGAPERQTLAALREALNDADSDVRQAASDALLAGK